MYTKLDPTPSSPGHRTQPSWWNNMHSSAWERVSEAFRRDWEQTKADFSVTKGRDLNQNVTDTVKQVVGKDGVPPLTVKTHPDTPEHAAKVHERVVKEQKKDGEKIAKAQEEIRKEQTNLRDKISDTQRAAEEDKLAADRNTVQTHRKFEEKMADIEKERREAEMRATEKANELKAKKYETVEKASEKVAAIETKTAEKIESVAEKSANKIEKESETIAKAANDRDEALARWLEVEPAARYGFGVRSQFAAPQTWTEKVEEKLRKEWTSLYSGSPWENVKNDVRRGWDYAAKEQAATPSKYIAGAGKDEHH